MSETNSFPKVRINTFFFVNLIIFKIKGMKISYVLILFVFCLYSCGNSTHEHVEPSQVEEEQNTRHNHENEVIELNKGEKWVVSIAMKPHLDNGRKLVEAYLSSGETDYQKLAQQLEDENEQLISNCKMTGKSHDELHKWLHPHLELVESLSSSTSEDAKIIVQQLKESYEKYAEYFQ
jgi:hypothetical protein